ncbi:MAG: preprotein translocase subunit YajC [Verrucomicrobiae bacterium]|nr:preprotein translocase subunit YajC [Verrucomicrobiae bacterium]NNJ87091.1 preprotein translocase subunit YajC [Akkermansiaceae bacterium]
MNNISPLLVEGNILGNPIIMMVLMFVIFWVVLIRPQQKQRKELAAKQAALKKGDKVITIGGMHATVNAVSERTVSLKLAEGIYVKYDKTAVATVIPKGTSAENAESAPASRG